MGKPAEADAGPGGRLQYLLEVAPGAGACEDHQQLSQGQAAARRGLLPQVTSLCMGRVHVYESNVLANA